MTENKYPITTVTTLNVRRTASCIASLHKICSDDFTYKKNVTSVKQHLIE